MTRAVRTSFAFGCLLLSICVTLLAGLRVDAQTPTAPQPEARPPLVYTVHIDGIIHPVATAYIRRAITEADAAKADLLVIVLKTPGGLVDATRDINTAIIQAKTPVAVFVSPAGSRAASAGFLITM